MCALDNIRLSFAAPSSKLPFSPPTVRPRPSAAIETLTELKPAEAAIPNQLPTLALSPPVERSHIYTINFSSLYTC